VPRRRLAWGGAGASSGGAAGARVTELTVEVPLPVRAGLPVEVELSLNMIDIDSDARDGHVAHEFMAMHALSTSFPYPSIYPSGENHSDHDCPNLSLKVSAAPPWQKVKSAPAKRKRTCA
jgi:hypothetical protein